MVLVGILIIIALILLKRAIFQPLQANRRWRKMAEEMDLRFFGDLSHEPVVSGTHNGVTFIAGISAHSTLPGRDERYRTLVSSPILKEVPAGLRIYGVARDEWSNDYSDRRRVKTGDEALEGIFYCEGIDAEKVRDFVSQPAHRERLLAFLDAWPGMLVHGGEGSQLPADANGSSGVVTVSIRGRQLDQTLIKRCIDDVCALATHFNSTIQSS